MNSLPMNAMNETSEPKAADPVSVFMGSTLDTSAGSVAFGGLEKGKGLTMIPDVGKLIQFSPSTAEALTAPPVACGEDDPTRICSYCSFAIHVGRGPTIKELCPICKDEVFPGGDL